MHLQVTTEAVGRYSPIEMRNLAYEVAPPGISIGIREMIPSRNPTEEDIKLYQSLTENGTKIQHICYEPEDLDLLSDLLNRAKISKDGTWCLFVIGHYSGKISDPNKIPLFLDKLNNNNFNADWAVCAFGKEEIDCLKKAISLDGKIRIGFENSMLMPNGEIAPNNHTKVKAVKEILNLFGLIFLARFMLPSVVDAKGLIPSSICLAIRWFSRNFSRRFEAVFFKILSL